MISALIPDSCAANIFKLDLAALVERGIKGLIFDLDNTIVRWGTDDVSPELKAFFLRTSEMGFSVCILSNNMRGRSQRIATLLGVPAIGRAMKPSRRGYQRAMQQMGLAPERVAVIGDQLFTDILGGKRAGTYTVLVKPLARRELVYTRIVRILERAVLARLAARGRIPIEWHTE